MAHTIYNSRMEQFRSPLGAIPTGGELHITVRPESHRFPLRGFLCTRFETAGEWKEIPMTHRGLFGDYDEYTVTLPVGNQPGLWFYHFRFENDGGSFRYGSQMGHTGGEAVFYDLECLSEFQLTVYAQEDREQMLDKFCGGIVYQIFPDRFCRDALYQDHPRAKERIFHEDWNEEPLYRPELFANVVQMTNRDFFGGTFRGIRSKLDYLKRMGVKTLYFNPIFEAFSNHRYDTADYTRVDANLGTEEDFRELCEAAHDRGMNIMLDGVFNHTGSDSVYFNARGTYPEPGAYQSLDSKWASWYDFIHWPDEYSSWWGIRTLPQTREQDPSYQQFIAGDKESVVRRWLRAGADGWRLDVADELPDFFIRMITKAVRAEKQDAAVIGEVWEDASNKISYDVRRDYLLGGALDGVTGYPFRNAALDFLRGGDGSDFQASLEDILENYPPRALLMSFNILGTHDTPRIITVLGAPEELWEGGREQRADYSLPEERYAMARRLLKLGAVLQYTFIGLPCVYYGDEAGLQGGEDPFNRRTFPWGQEDMELLDWYRRLGELRSRLDVLQRGKLEFLQAKGPTICFRRIREGNQLLIAVNRSDAPEAVEGLPAGTYEDMISHRMFVIPEENQVLPPYSGMILAEVAHEV